MDLSTKKIKNTRLIQRKRGPLVPLCAISHLPSREEDVGEPCTGAPRAAPPQFDEQAEQRRVQPLEIKQQ